MTTNLSELNRTVSSKDSSPDPDEKSIPNIASFGVSLKIPAGGMSPLEKKQSEPKNIMSLSMPPSPDKSKRVTVKEDAGAISARSKKAETQNNSIDENDLEKTQDS